MFLDFYGDLGAGLALSLNRFTTSREERALHNQLQAGVLWPQTPVIYKEALQGTKGSGEPGYCGGGDASCLRAVRERRFILELVLLCKLTRRSDYQIILGTRMTFSNASDSSGA